MPSAEEREQQDPNRIRELLAAMNRGGRPPERSDRADEKDALQEQLEALRREYGEKERMTHNQMVAAMQRANSQAPIYNDDLPHR